MFRIGDTVIHPAEGVCEITEITEKTFGGKAEEYYVLKSVYDGQATVYIPVETVRLKKKIRRALSKTEIDGIIGLLPESEPIETDNDNQRRLLFKDILTSGDTTEISRMLKTVYRLKNEIRKSGKKMKVSDERIIKETERSLFYEFAFSLGVEPDTVDEYINGALNINK